MIGRLRTRVRKQPIIALYFQFETVLRFNNLETWPLGYKLEFILRLKIKGNDWLIKDTCPKAAKHCAFILSPSLYSSFITSRPDLIEIYFQSMLSKMNFEQP